jgi:hypothetical protein
MFALSRTILGIDSVRCNNAGTGTVGAAIRCVFARQNVPAETISQAKHDDRPCGQRRRDGTAGKAGGSGWREKGNIRR